MVDCINNQEVIIGFGELVKSFERYDKKVTYISIH